jgi:hypothetical protein
MTISKKNIASLSPIGASGSRGPGLGVRVQAAAAAHTQPPSPTSRRPQPRPPPSPLPISSARRSWGARVGSGFGGHRIDRRPPPDRRQRPAASSAAMRMLRRSHPQSASTYQLRYPLLSSWLTCGCWRGLMTDEPHTATRRNNEIPKQRGGVSKSASRSVQDPLGLCSRAVLWHVNVIRWPCVGFICTTETI